MGSITFLAQLSRKEFRIDVLLVANKTTKHIHLLMTLRFCGRDWKRQHTRDEAVAVILPLGFLTSSSISLFLWSNSGNSCINTSMAFNPPFSLTAEDLSNNDLGIVCPDKSSMAAGKFSDARTLASKKTHQDENRVCTTEDKPWAMGVSYCSTISLYLENRISWIQTRTATSITVTNSLLKGKIYNTKQKDGLKVKP